jgi:hypothetical protein
MPVLALKRSLTPRFTTEAEPLGCSIISALALDIPVMLNSPQYNVGLVAIFWRSGSRHYAFSTKVFEITSLWLRLLLKPWPYIS